MEGLIPPLLTPVGVAVVGALLWWRIGHVEKEVGKLRTDRHELGNDVAKMQGTVETLKEVVIDVLRATKAA